MTVKRFAGLGVVCALLLAVVLGISYAQSSKSADSRGTDNNNYYVYEDGYNKLRCELYRAKYSNAERLIELRSDFETLIDEWLMTPMYRDGVKLKTNTPQYYADTVGYDIDRMTLRRLEDIRDAAMNDRENISPEWSAKVSRLIALRQALDNTETLIKEIRQDISRVEDEKGKPDHR